MSEYTSESNALSGNMYSRGGPQFMGGNVSNNTFIFGRNQGSTPEGSSKNYRLGLYLPENVPMIDDDAFIGRKDELLKLKQDLVPQPQSKSQRITIVSGLGGVGKTQLTISFAKRNQEAFSAIFWFDSRSESLLKQSFVENAARIFQTPVIDPDKEGHAIDEVRHWLSEESNNGWLLIFDNYDSSSLDRPAKQDKLETFNLKHYFPFKSQGSILVSTRRSRLNWGKVLSLKSLQNIDESLEILANRSARADIENDIGARELAKRLDGLPLALVTAGSYLSQAPDTPEEYLNMYEQSWQELASCTEELLDYEGRTLYSTWNISYTQIQAQNADAADLFKFIAQFDNQDIWFDLLAKGKGCGFDWLDRLLASKIRFNQAMAKLLDYSLIEFHVDTGGWSLHNCVHDWALEHLNANSEIALCWLSIHCISESVVPETEAGYCKTNRRLIRHANRLNLKDLDKWLDSEAQSLLMFMYYRISYLFDHLWRHTEAETICKLALKGFERVLGSDHPMTLQLVNNLGVLYRAQDKLDDAEKMYGQALEGLARVFGLKHELTIDTIHNMAVLCVYQDRLDEAEKMFKRALKGYNKALGPDHIKTVRLVGNLGTLYKRQGKLDSAEKTLEQALEVHRKILEPNHQLTLTAKWSLAQLYKSTERAAAAVELFKIVAHGYADTLGPDHSRTRLAEFHSLLDDVGGST